MIVYWRGFRRGDWCHSIAVRDFIVRNVSPYEGDETFLVGPSKRTKAVWEKLQPYFQEEQKKGVLAVDAKTPSTLLAHQAGYIDRENEVIVGLQTDQPFKRAIFPFGGLRMVEAGLKAAGFEADPRSAKRSRNTARPTMTGCSTLIRLNHAVPEVRHHHRPSRCLWPRPHHRRLPARRALRRGPAARSEKRRARASSTTCGPART